MRVRKSDVFILFMFLSIVVLGILAFHARTSSADARGSQEERKNLVRHFMLTDICLFTDARYTRNPSMADMNASFQDNPLSFDHFPSGSLMPVPPHLRRHDMD